MSLFVATPKKLQPIRSERQTRLERGTNPRDSWPSWTDRVAFAPVAAPAHPALALKAAAPPGAIGGGR